MPRYGQFCPVAKAAEILGERWTLLIVRELLFGSTRYADLKRGLGRISPSVLSQRLKTLCDAGVVVKRRGKDGTPQYILTECGRELQTLVETAGTWGQRWARSSMTKDELDLDLLVLDMERNINPTPFPNHTVLCMTFGDVPARLKRWWVLIDDGKVEICTDPPGRTPLIRLETSLRTMARIWIGDVTFQQAIEGGLLDYEGPDKYRKKAKEWLRLSSLAGVEPAA